MGKYKLVRVLAKKSTKSDKIWHYAHILLFSDNDTDLIKVFITDKQAQALIKVVEDTSFDINKYVNVDYNTYKKVYELKVSYGL